MLHDSAVNHESPRHRWAEVTCNMPILASRWDINKLQKRKTRISCRKWLNIFFSSPLARSLRQVSIMSFSSRHRDLQLCWLMLKYWRLVKGANQQEAYYSLHCFLCKCNVYIMICTSAEQQSKPFNDNKCNFGSCTRYRMIKANNKCNSSASHPDVAGTI